MSEMENSYGIFWPRPGTYVACESSEVSVINIRDGLKAQCEYSCNQSTD
jgi:hypothetical protein